MHQRQISEVRADPKEPESLSRSILDGKKRHLRCIIIKLDVYNDILNRFERMAVHAFIDRRSILVQADDKMLDVLAAKLAQRPHPYEKQPWSQRPVIRLVCKEHACPLKP